MQLTCAALLIHLHCPCASMAAEVSITRTNWGRGSRTTLMVGRWLRGAGEEGFFLLFTEEGFSFWSTLYLFAKSSCEAITSSADFPEHTTLCLVGGRPGKSG